MSQAEWPCVSPSPSSVSLWVGALLAHSGHGLENPLELPSPITSLLTSQCFLQLPLNQWPEALSQVHLLVKSRLR